MGTETRVHFLGLVSVLESSSANAALVSKERPADLIFVTCKLSVIQSTVYSWKISPNLT